MSEQSNTPPTVQWGAPQPQAPKPKHAKGTGRVAIAIYAGVVGLIIGTAGSSEDPTTTVTAGSDTPTATKTVEVEVPGPTKTVEVEVPGPTKTVVAKPKGPAGNFPGDGMFLVGEDIQAGTYRSNGGGSCYWARLSGLSGELGDILANENASAVTIATISSSDEAFETSGCGDWERIK